MTARVLSPPNLIELLAPALDIGRRPVAGYQAFDVYPHSSGSSLCVELRPEEDESGPALLLEVRPARSDHPAATEAGGLAFNYVDPGPVEAGIRLCRTLAARLAQVLPSDAEWVVLNESLALRPTVLREEVYWERADLDGDPDRRLLSLDAAQYTSLYGARPEVRRVRTGGRHNSGVSIHFPAPRIGHTPNCATVYPSPPQLGRRRRFRRYFALLGCLFNSRSELRTVPTPDTFERALQGNTDQARLRVCVLSRRQPVLSPGEWLRNVVVRQVVPVNIAPRRSVERHRVIRRLGLSHFEVGVGTLAHDMGLAVAVHAIPRPAWDELAGCAASLGPREARRLFTFFDERLVTRCWDVWRDLPDPEDFPRVFEAGFAELMTELKGRGE